jgi:hypothetical protein
VEKAKGSWEEEAREERSRRDMAYWRVEFWKEGGPMLWYVSWLWQKLLLLLMY